MTVANLEKGMLLIKPAAEPVGAWAAQFARLMPGLQIVVWDEVRDRASVDYALVANPPFGWLANFPALKLIVSLPAGLDHLLNDPEFPRHIPLARCLPPAGDPMMTEYALLHVLRHHRQLQAYAEFQARHEWHKLPQPPASERRVGIMGAGIVGRAAARAIQTFGFEVATWSRRPKELQRIASFAGEAELSIFLARTDILLCLLPMTVQTKGILNVATMSHLPAGASIINLSRGALLVESDLLKLLNTGHLSGATLDVTEVEPLPESSPLWKHPRITITPHIGSVVRAANAAPVVAENIRRLERGEDLINLVDVASGY